MGQQSYPLSRDGTQSKALSALTSEILDDILESLQQIFCALSSCL
jgi:hypothetical protein